FILLFRENSTLAESVSFLSVIERSVLFFRRSFNRDRILGLVKKGGVFPNTGKRRPVGKFERLA
ncbi:MAG: hypothetical protein II596_07290, partial [Thermoguttaceae bacterium]|nr:hypothetical protein [Thermoguttaceae bacterium]